MYSHSRINCFKLCPKQYEYKYIKHLYPLSDNNNLMLGNILHKGIELKSIPQLLNYIEELNITPNESTETLVTLALAMVEAYFKKYGYNEIVKNELHFEFPFEENDFKLHGYIDGIIEEPDGYWLLEIKTASIINKDYIDKLMFNDQISRYMYAVKNGFVEDFKLDKPLLGIKYRIIKKPMIRQKQKETIVEFRNRLIEKLQEEEYMIELLLNRTDEEIMECIRDTAEDIITMKTAGRFTKTLSACSTYGRCPYMELCCNEPNGELLYMKKEERTEENVTSE